MISPYQCQTCGTFFAELLFNKRTAYEYLPDHEHPKDHLCKSSRQTWACHLRKYYLTRDIIPFQVVEELDGKASNA